MKDGWKFDTGLSKRKANMRMLQARNVTRLCNAYAPFSLPTQLRAVKLTKSKEEGGIPAALTARGLCQGRRFLRLATSGRVHLI